MMWKLGVVVGSFVVTSFGSESAIAADFTWTAPNTCPNELEVRSQVERGLGVKFATLPDLTFEASARDKGKGYELELKTRKGKSTHVRRVRADTCDELINVLVAAMSLALESLSPPSNTTPGDSQAQPRPEPEPQTEPPTSSPTSSPRRRSEEVLKPSPKPVYSALIGAGAFVDVGTLPEPAYGGELSVGVGRDAWKLRALGVMVPRQQSTLRGTAEAHFDFVAGGLGVCGSPVRKLVELRGCLSGEFGRLHGEGYHVRNPRKASALWGAAIPELWALVRPNARGWSLFGHVDVPLAVYRKSFELTELGDVHTPALAAVRVALGLELDLL